MSSTPASEPVPAPAASAPVPPAPAAPAPAASAPLTIAAAVSGALALLRSKAAVGTDLAQAREQLATVTRERDESRTQVATLTAQVAAFAAFFGIEPAALAGKDSAACAQLLTDKISAAAADQVAALGFNTTTKPLPAAAKAEAGAKEMAYAEWRALPPMKQAEFIRSGGQLSDTPSFSRN